MPKKACRRVLGLNLVFWIFLAAAIPPATATSSVLANKIIVIDPGHGTLNFEGRIINSGKENKAGYREHKINMLIAEALGELLRKEGTQVYFTRTWNDYWRQGPSTVQDNKARAHLANELGADAFISIHCDWHPSSKVRGVTTLYGKSQSKRLAKTLHQTLVRRLQARDRKTVFDSYTVLDVCEVPAVIIETGFLSNLNESRKLIKTTYQKEVASALLAGLKNYFSN